MIRLALCLYRALISPALHLFFGPGMGCRFQPSCSQYAQEAFAARGPLQGGFLTLHRLCRCHPFSKGGYDPVPFGHRNPPLAVLEE